MESTQLQGIQQQLSVVRLLVMSLEQFNPGFARTSFFLAGTPIVVGIINATDITATSFSGNG